MNRFGFKACLSLLALGIVVTSPAIADDIPADSSTTPTAPSDVAPTSTDANSAAQTPADNSAVAEPKESLKPEATEEAPKQTPTKHKANAASKNRHAEAFVAGPDWQFDGFVAGGQDEDIKSMFSINDLLYLNIGDADGFASGDRLGVYRRGERIRDPQTHKMIGYEVRKVAIAEITDRVDTNSSSARILKSYESVELGDLVRRED